MRARGDFLCEWSPIWWSEAFRWAACVYVTELDVNLISLDGSEDEKLAARAEVFASLLEVCLAVPACRSYTMWGSTCRHASVLEGGSLIQRMEHTRGM